MNAPSPPPAGASTRAAGADRELLLLGLTVLLLGATLRVSPDAGGVVLAGWTLPETCPLKLHTGWDCPGCGLTRSCVSSLRFDWPRALALNPAGPLFLVVILAQIPYRSYRLVQRRRGRIHPEDDDAPEKPVWRWLHGFLFGSLFLQWGVLGGIRLWGAV